MNNALYDITDKIERNIRCDFDLSDISRQNEVNSSIFNLLVVLQCLKDILRVYTIQQRQPSQAADGLFDPGSPLLGQFIKGPADARRGNHAIANSFAMLDTRVPGGSLDSMTYG